MFHHFKKTITAILVSATLISSGTAKAEFSPKTHKAIAALQRAMPKDKSNISPQIKRDVKVKFIALTKSIAQDVTRDSRTGKIKDALNEMSYLQSYVGRSKQLKVHTFVMTPYLLAQGDLEAALEQQAEKSLAAIKKGNYYQAFSLLNIINFRKVNASHETKKIVNRAKATLQAVGRNQDITLKLASKQKGKFQIGDWLTLTVRITTTNITISSNYKHRPTNKQIQTDLKKLPLSLKNLIAQYILSDPNNTGLTKISQKRR